MALHEIEVDLSRNESCVTPIAVVGMAFRFPGDLGDELSFWQALTDKRDLVTQIDSQRWDTERLQHPKRSEPGRSNTFAAGVLSHVDQFDAGFFGISPREAASLDPQQRLLLELAWESIENAGIRSSSIAGSDCAVYVGISGVDYGMRAMDDLAVMSSHSMTGNTLSITANRISYFFDLRGPSVAVDTACSSSLVALHHACNSLRSGESSMALVGGVNLLLHPSAFVGFTKASMLSVDGQCRAFDASGNGYVRSEGGAVFVLKPLEKAVADGDTIQAVILASGANSDGGRKTSLTIPSRDGQTELMRDVLSRSGLSANDVDYIEAHGTGTVVGDPIEAAAIGAVYGGSRANGAPLPIGSVKTNLGHLEPASGMAGLAKAILMLKNRTIPPSLHMVTLNPHIDFAGLNLNVVTQCQPLSTDPKKATVVGVNSFGFGGTNAHVLIQEYRPANSQQELQRTVSPPLFLSARTAQALRDVAGRYAMLLQEQPQALYDIAFSAALRRDPMDKRLAIQVENPLDMAAELAAFSRGEPAPHVVREDAPIQPGGIAFIYSGNGSQWLGMGQRLMVDSPRFSEILIELDASIREAAGFSILDELLCDATTSRLSDTAIAQPLLFALQVALTRMLSELGINPVAVAGHSVGEIAAAWAAGALSLDQAILVICARSAAQALTRGTGRMAAVSLSEVAARELIAVGEFNSIEIAGINSPNYLTLSGPLVVLERFGHMLESRRIFFRLLDLDYAFHSRTMDPIKVDLLERLVALTPNPCSDVAFVSTVTGDVLAGLELDAEYWWRNIRQPVRFTQAISTLAQRGCRVFIEIGPHAILQRYIKDSLTADDVPAAVVPTLRRDDDGLERLEEAALRAHMLLVPHQLGSFFPTRRQNMSLPNYPWQRERHWHAGTNEAYGVLEQRRVHPLLGWRLKDVTAAWENVIDPDICDWLGDHKVANAIVLPGSAYIEIALAAAREYFGGYQQEMEELEILSPMVFDGEHARCLRFELSVRDGGFQILSRQRLSTDDWNLNAVGQLLGAPVVSEGTGSVSFLGQKPEDAISVDHDTHYRLTSALGLDYGPSFQGLDCCWIQGHTLQVKLGVPAAVQEAVEQYLIHPALLDVCFQSLVDFFQEDIEAGQGVPFLPVKVGRLRLYGNTPIAHFRVYLRRRGSRSLVADFELLDAAGRIIATLAACRFRAAPLQRRKQAPPACWTTVAHLKPTVEDQLYSPIPSSRDLTKHLQVCFSGMRSATVRTDYFQGALPLFEALTVSFVGEVFQELSTQIHASLQHALARPETVDPVVRPFFLWIINVLQQNDLLVMDSGGEWTLRPTDLPPAQSIWRTLLRDYPENLPELVLSSRTGRELAGLIRSSLTGESLARKLRHNHQYELLFNDSPSYVGTRFAIQNILQTLAADWPVHRRLRVLEIIAGSNASVEHVVTEVPGVQLDYVVASANAEVHSHLQAEYDGHPFVVVVKAEGDALDLVAVDAIPEHFDVIILEHVLHRSNHAPSALTALRRRLAKSGLLILAERHPDMVADFIFGLDAAWWRTSQSGAVIARLATPKSWERTLSDQGFVDIEIFQEPASEDLAAGAYLVLSKRSVEDAILIAPPVVQSWLLVGDVTGPVRLVVDSLRSHLESRGQNVRQAVLGKVGDLATDLHFIPQSPESAEELLTTGRSILSRIDNIVYMAGVVTSVDADVADLTDRNVVAALHLVRALARTTDQTRLWLVTAGGALFEGAVHNPIEDVQQAALWGFGRVVMNEYPALACTLIDFDIHQTSVSDLSSRLEYELLFPDGEREIVLTSAGRYGLRMQRASPLSAHKAADRYRLDFAVPGQLRNLAWLPQVERALAANEMEVRVAATGLNFRDVMYVMGLLPDEAVESGFAGASLGLEFSGVVSRVGGDCDGFVVGDAVMGFGAACFSSHVVTQTSAVTHKPTEWSFEAAATVPTVFFTVYYALKQLADLQSGERVLIHGAAGGVGIAAIQLALHLGAEIFATVGSDDKRDFVALLGADHVYDSRSLDFADNILSRTGGEGVDVVLNSLAGEAIRRNLKVLKPFGRFLELGKRDFFENTPIGLRPFKNNISYFGIDADQLLLARPTLATRLFREVMALFRQGVLFPLPYRTFPASQVVDAFRAMQQSRHIGKVVVNMSNVPAVENPTEIAAPRIRFSSESVWLVTGGLSGFGLESARWLAQRGAGQLVLVGRRGLDTPGAAIAVAEFIQLGSQVQVVACDVTNRGDVQALLDDLQHNGTTLTGILHAAMVLDDTMIGNMDADCMRKVLAPKMRGAWNLHCLTLDMRIDHFVLYSSITSSMGNPGQANYVAANAALEGLATMRRAMGLPATCIGWGPIGDAGYLTRNQAVKDSLASRLGAEPLHASAALAMLDGLLSGPAVTTTVADFDWHTLARLLPSSQSARFDILRKQAGTANDANSDNDDLQTLIAGKSADEVRVIIQTLVTREISQVLCVRPEHIELNQSLHDLGMDSLMGVELALGLEKRFGIQLPPMMLSEGPSVERVTRRIVDRILGSSDKPETAQPDSMDSVVSMMATQHGEEFTLEEVSITVAHVRTRTQAQG